METYLAATFAIAFLVAFVWCCIVDSIDIKVSRKTTFIVRCKNCRKYDLETQCCKFWPDQGYRHPDHFCAEGKRRDDHETDCHEAD